MTANAGLALFIIGVIIYPLIMYGIFVFERHVTEEKRRREEEKNNPLYKFWNE